MIIFRMFICYTFNMYYIEISSTYMVVSIRGSIQLYKYIPVVFRVLKF